MRVVLIGKVPNTLKSSPKNPKWQLSAHATKNPKHKKKIVTPKKQAVTPKKQVVTPKKQVVTILPTLKPEYIITPRPAVQKPEYTITPRPSVQIHQEFCSSFCDPNPKSKLRKCLVDDKFQHCNRCSYKDKKNVHIPVSSEYTANGETFKIEDNKLTPLWKKNPIYCRWVWTNSNSANDYPYLLNNSILFEKYN